MPVVPDDLTDKQIAFAIEQSNRAIQELTKSSSQRTMPDMMDVMTACVMFYCLCCFQGHQATALEHLHSGLKILHQLDQAMDCRTDDQEVHPVSLKTLRAIFVTMDVQARGVMSKEMLETWAKRPKRNFSSPPRRFVTFAQARYAFEAVYHELMGFMQGLDIDPPPPEVDPSEWIQSEYEQFQSAFDALSICLDEFLAPLTHITIQEDRDSVLGIKLFREQIRIYLRLFKGFDPVKRTREIEWQVEEEDMKTILDLACELLRAPPDVSVPAGAQPDDYYPDNTDPAYETKRDIPAYSRPVFSSNSGLLSALWLVVSKSRSSALRRRAIALMLDFPRREGIWDGVVAGRVAWEVLRLEETAVDGVLGADPERQAETIPDINKVRDCNITYIAPRVMEVEFRSLSQWEAGPNARGIKKVLACVFPSSYKNVSKDAVKESTKVQVEAKAELPQAGREGHSERQESFSVHVNQPAERPAKHRDTYTEEVRVFEDRQRRPQQPQQHREEVHIHEEHRYRQPEQVRRTERVEVDIHEHRDSRDRTYDRDFNAVQGAQSDYATTQVDVSERQFRERTRPIVGGYAHDSHNLSTEPNYEQASRYRKESFDAKHDTYPSRREVDAVDSRYPHREEVRVETTRSTVDAPKKHKRDMGYYDDDGHYHSFRHGIKEAAHKVADHIAHPIHGSRHHHSHDHSSKASQHKDIREDIVVKEKYTTSSAPAPTHFRDTHVPAPAPRASAPAPAPTYRPSAGPSTVSSHKTVTTRKMAPPNTITIPCHHIRIGDLLILQGRPCQVIRITTSSQTGQHRYLGVDLFTKQLHEESSFISNPAPSVVVQNMLGPVFKQYRVLDIREDGRVVAMTETGDVKQGLPILDQSNLLQRLTESFDNGRGSVRILVINDDGMEMAVDYKVVHGSRL
ncbi:hypothetical protein SLS60_004509 [Paraconiothyrium brasiliense]|uniref:Translation initiation factor 5A-like N-terminal domain-containing protein n=1 Tax=Paraconiothyrium brasiliense TaxID=300254 RepID=A0ABR3RL11_9PLEO